MKNRILASVLAGAFLVISACGDQESSAPTELGPSLHTAPAPFNAVVTLTGGFEDPMCVSVEDGTLIFDECTGPEIIEGDLVGPGTATADQEVDLATGNGELEGRAIFGTDEDPACLANDVCGIFEGKFKGDVIGFLFVGEFKIRGISEDVKGIRMEGTDVERGPPGTLIFDLVGTIRFPS